MFATLDGIRRNVDGMVDRHGPTGIYGWQVQIDGYEVSGVNRLVIPAISTEESSESGSHPWGDTTYQDFEMEVAAQDGGDSTIADWQEQITTDDPSGLKEIEVTLLDTDGSEIGTYVFHDGWIKYYGPVEYDAANDQPHYTRELVTIAFDSMEWQEA